MSRQFNNSKDCFLWFDLDDTLWAMTDNSVICLRELYDELNLGRYFATPAQWDDIYHRINRELWEQYANGEISRDYLRSERFARPLRAVGVCEDDALAIAKIADSRYLELLGQKPTLIDGARQLLDALSARGYRMGIVSNGFHEVQYNKMRSSDIERYFELVVLSDDAGVNKPDNRFFEYATTRAKSQRLINIIIGDNYKADIEGGLAAGWEAIWFNDGGKEDIATDSRVLEVRSLEELQKHFEEG